MSTFPVSAAQYLRMSTEHQQYSLENQATAIGNYAQLNGFEIVRTYSDAARSGVSVRRRTALKRLLRDVTRKDCAYNAILVYDVSRWGRFQDTDEAAHYEFLCKSAGRPVHYCAETFANDNTLTSLIMKALKRTMAAEYSREMGVKILAGLKRIVRGGFKPGGPPGYGLRRMLISADGKPKQMLAFGERKSLLTDRVVFVPGPDSELQVIREIYRMFISERRNPLRIARILNGQGIPGPDRCRWSIHSVCEILSHPKYTGCLVYGRSTARLYTPKIPVPKSEWVMVPGAFEAIIDTKTFDEAQAIFSKWTINRSDDELIADLKQCLAANGKLTKKLIDSTRGLPSATAYQNRFGSLKAAYQLAGYGRPGDYGNGAIRQRVRAVRDELIDTIVATCPDVAAVRKGARYRRRLKIGGRYIVSVLHARFVPLPKSIRWQVRVVKRERKFMTLLVRLNDVNTSWKDFYLLPNVDRLAAFRLLSNDPWLQGSIKFHDLSQFREMVDKLLRRKNRGAGKRKRTNKSKRVFGYSKGPNAMRRPRNSRLD